MAITQLSELNSLYPNFYERALFVARDQNLMTQLVTTRDGNGWAPRILSTRPQITAGTVAEMTDYSNPATFGLTSPGTLTPLEMIAQVKLTDRDQETDPWGALNDAVRELGASMATRIDIDLMANFNGFGVSKGTAGSVLPLRVVAAALSRIDGQHARQYGYPNVVIHPYQWHDIYLELGQTSTGNPPSEAANKVMRDYFMTNALAANWYVSTNTAGTAQSGTAVYGGAFVQDALMFDVRRAPTLEVERDISARLTEIQITAGYATGTFRKEFGCGILADATEPT
ncbi:MAG: hypothetical protein E6R03_00460 [Hyphomicrobiaceae bacterium]|jgi:hypothetical protein|nr:MAG: hypothetical protein E6R03_00460 [Hyphomicrobiaceae bacterium]